MQIFYAPDIDGEVYQFNEEESKHCIRVLRHNEGDTVHLTDGCGNMHTCCITLAHPKRCILRVVETIKNYKQLPYRLHIAAAPTKSIERYEWMLEKITEIGVDTITPIESYHCERRIVKTDRLEKVITTAVKQSIKAYHPKLNIMQEFESFVCKDFGTAELFIAHCNDSENKILLRDLVVKGREYVILVGPEGDFSQQEVDLAVSKGFKEISLGDSRLRTETAGVMATAIVSIINM